MGPYNLAYQAEFNEDFGAFGGGAAIAAFTVLGAVEVCAAAEDLSRSCMVDALTNLELDTTPMSVSVSFGPGNQGEGAFFLYQVQEGTFNLIQR